MLYKITDTEKYGTVLATDSKGQYVFEVKGTGEIIPVAKDKVEEVLPYTVGVKFFQVGGMSKTYQFISYEGQFSKGDLLFYSDTGGFATITGINTKAKSATKYFKGWKINAETVEDNTND